VSDLLFEYKVRAKHKLGFKEFSFYATTDIEEFLNRNSIDYVRNATDTVENRLFKENKRLNNIIKELDKQNGELGADLSIIKDTIDKTNWWLEQMLKQATNNETKAIINGALELLLDKENVKAIPPEVIGTNGEDGWLFDYGDKGE